MKKTRYAKINPDYDWNYDYDLFTEEYIQKSQNKNLIPDFLLAAIKEVAKVSKDFQFRDDYKS